MLVVSSYSYTQAVSQGRLDPDLVMDKAKEMGFEGIEFAGLWVPQGMTAKEYAKKLKEKAGSLGMTISGYSVGANFLCQDIDAEIERVKGEVDVAEALGVKFMRHDVAYGPKPGGYKSFENNLPFLIKGAKAVTEYAQAKGIKTMVENHGFFCQDSHRVEQLIDGVNSENYGALIDIGNFLCVDEDPAKAAGVLAPYAMYVHCKDFFFRDGSNPPAGKQGWIYTRGGNYIKGSIVGQGVVPVGKVLNLLKTRGFNGFIAIEFEGSDECIGAIAQGKEFVQKFL